MSSHPGFLSLVRFLKELFFYNYNVISFRSLTIISFERRPGTAGHRVRQTVEEELRRGERHSVGHYKALGGSHERTIHLRRHPRLQGPAEDRREQ